MIIPVGGWASSYFRRFGITVADTFLIAASSIFRVNSLFGLTATTLAAATTTAAAENASDPAKKSSENSAEHTSPPPK
jgi:hypothetical protein